MQMYIDFVVLEI